MAQWFDPLRFPPHLDGCYIHAPRARWSRQAPPAPAARFAPTFGSLCSAQQPMGGHSLLRSGNSQERFRRPDAQETWLFRVAGLFNGPILLLLFFSCQKSSDNASQQDKRCGSYEYPFHGMNSHSDNGGFRGTGIPAQVRALDYGQGRKYHDNSHTQGNTYPMNDLPPRCFSLGELMVDNLQLFGNRLYVIPFRLSHCFSKQRAYGGFQYL